LLLIPKKYFRFPVGTTFGAVYNAVSPFIGTSAHDGCGAIGRYGDLSINLVWRFDSTQIRFQESGGPLRVAIVSGSSTTITAELKVEIIV
jgi:hypothetical protein